MSNFIKIITHSDNQAEIKQNVTAGSGKTGNPTVIKVIEKARYELLDAETQYAPQQILLVRKGKDLHILVNAQGNADELLQPADLVIQDYYEYGKSQLVGLAEDQQYYNYLPQEGTDDLLAWNLIDQADTYQSLGEYHTPTAWWPFLLGGLAFAELGGAGDSDV